MNNKPTIERRRLGKTGLQVSALGFGAAPIGFLKTERDQIARLLNLLLDGGINLIDTAAGYQGSEEFIGEMVGHRRDQFVLVSKCGTNVSHLKERTPWSAALIADTVDASLKRLRTDRLDVMLLHTCEKDVLEKGEALGALARARDAGKVRFVGFSGDNDAAAYAAMLPDVSVIEMSVNLVDQANLQEALPACRKHDIGVLAKRPIANAAWKDLESQPGFYKGYARDYTERLPKLGIRPTQFGWPDDSGASWGELALRFTLSQPAVHCAIIGTTNPANAQANIAAAAKGPLPANIVQAIRDAFRRADPTAQWPGLT